MLLQITVAGITVRGVPIVFSTSVWLLLLVAAYVGMMYLVHRHHGRPRWTSAAVANAPTTMPTGTIQRAPRISISIMPRHIGSQPPCCCRDWQRGQERRWRA